MAGMAAAIPIHTNLKFGMAAPYQSAEIWAVDFQENHKNCCHQMSDLKAKMHQNRFRLGLCPRPRWGAYSAPSGPLAGFKGSYF